MANEQWIWIDPDNTQYILSGAAGRTLLSATNVGPAEHQHFVQQFPGLHGGFRVGGIDPPRIITLGIQHISTIGGRTQFYDDRETIIGLLNPLRGISTLRLIKPNGEKADIRGYAYARPEMDMEGWGNVGQILTLQFWCPWPYWYDPDEYNSSTNTDGEVTLTLTLSGTSTISASAPNGTLANGFVDSYPHEFTITGQATNPDVWISGQSSRINFNSTAGYTIAAGNTVTIYTMPFASPRALLNNTTRVDGYVDKVTTTWAFMIPTGGGTLNAKGTNAGDNGVVTVKYRQYRRGI